MYLGTCIVQKNSHTILIHVSNMMVIFHSQPIKVIDYNGIGLQNIQETTVQQFSNLHACVLEGATCTQHISETECCLKYKYIILQIRYIYIYIIPE